MIEEYPSGSDIMRIPDGITFEQHRLMGMLEQHAEFDGVLLVISESNTAMAEKSAGIPAVLSTGNFDNQGHEITLRVDKICNDYPWKRFKAEFFPPTDRSFLSRAFTRLPTNYLTWLVKDFTPRYKNLPKKVLDQILSLAQLMTTLKILEEKVKAQREGQKAFACPWVFEQMSRCLDLREMYVAEIIEINKRAKAHRITGGLRGISEYEAKTRRIALDAKYHMQANRLWQERPSGILEPLPSGTPKIVLLQQGREHGDV